MFERFLMTSGDEDNFLLKRGDWGSDDIAIEGLEPVTDANFRSLRQGDVGGDASLIDRAHKCLLLSLVLDTILISRL